MKISELGEIGLIKNISKKTKLFSDDIIKGIGDDTAVLRYNKKYYLLLTTDTLVENDHFKTAWFTPQQIGKKAIESNVSDIAAMGGFPKNALISLVLPKNTSVDFIDKLYKGFNKTAGKYKIDIIGGNIASGKNISITLTLMGLVEKKKLCLRSDAKTNDMILVTGTLGNSRSGLELLRKKKNGKSINRYLNPKSNIKISRELAGKCNAMEDISDGLASEIKNICQASNIGAVIYKEKIPLSISTKKDAKKIKKNPYDFALYGGEDYELVLTMTKKNYKNLKNKKNLHIVGKILPKNKGIFILNNGKKKKLNYGYDHFKSKL